MMWANALIWYLTCSLIRMGIRYNKALGKNFRPDEVPVVFLYCFSPFLWRLSRRSILGFVPGGLSEGEAQSKCLEALSDNSDTIPRFKALIRCSSHNLKIHLISEFKIVLYKPNIFFVAFSSAILTNQ